MSKAKFTSWLALSSLAVLCVIATVGFIISDAFGADEPGTTLAPVKTPHPAAGYIALAASTSIAGGMLGAGYAVGRVGAAALGAASERPELMGRALLFVAMGEGIAVLGLVGGVLLMANMSL